MGFAVSGELTSIAYCLLILPVLSYDIYSSTDHLATVFKAEKEIIEHLENYILNFEAKFSFLRAYIDDFKRVHGSMDPQEVVSDPISAYQLVKRLTLNWYEIEEVLNDNSWQDLIELYKSYENLLIFDQQNLDGATTGILRLQETYELNATDLARGKILGIQTSTRLTIEDCFDIAYYCSYNGFLNLAFEWYDQALRVSKEELEPSISPEEIIPYLEGTIKEHDLALQIGGVHEHIFPIPIKDRTPAEIKRLASSPQTYTLGQLNYDYNIDINSDALCRGEQLRSFADEANLNCYLSHRGDASFYINPIKVEVHSHYPQLITFHDIIYESEINIIKKFSMPLLHRSGVGYPDYREGNERISMTAWLSDDEEDDTLRQTLRNVLNRLDRITGLNVRGKNNSEQLQVANYGIGGHFQPHHDYFLNERTSEQWGDNVERHATLMFYLNDVTMGGATAFPSVGTSVWPIKGSALFWYDLLQNGDPDPLTWHAACPVLYGSKWIATKWILDLNQAFKRPCSLNPTD